MGNVRWLGKFLVTFILLGCASTEQAVEDVAKRAALIAARPVLEKIFLTEAPIFSSSSDLYPLLRTLPGKPFNPRNYFKNRFQLTKGSLKLSPGDYIFPVMTYCMKSSGSSPSAHRYSLGKLSGIRARVIRDLNARALSLYAPHDIQVLSWSIQNDIPYQEMSDKSKEIVDKVIPEHQTKLKVSLYQSLNEKWNRVTEKTGLPNLEVVTDGMLSSLGTFGDTVRDIRNFRKVTRESGFEYDSLQSLISLPGSSQDEGTEETTSWSQISDNVFARFLTSGHYLDIGQLQIRVVDSDRSPKAIVDSLFSIDISAFIADPGVRSIQPLSFSILVGGIAIPFIAKGHPELVAAFLVGLITAEYTDWEAVDKALKQFGGIKDVQALLAELRQMFAKEFGQKPGEVVLPPSVLEAFPNTERVRGKTTRAGGSKRARWEDADGNIYEWDYQHGKLEKYDRRGKHQGEYDPKTGKQTKPSDPTRRVEP